MIHYPIKSLDNKFTYSVGVTHSKDRAILQLQDLDNEQSVRLTLNKQEAMEIINKLRIALYELN